MPAKKLKGGAAFKALELNASSQGLKPKDVLALDGALKARGAAIMKGMGYDCKCGDKMSIPAHQMDGKGIFGDAWRGIKKAASFAVREGPKAVKKLLDLGKSVGITPSAIAEATGHPELAMGARLIGQGKRGRGDRTYYSANSTLSDGVSRI